MRLQFEEYKARLAKLKDSQATNTEKYPLDNMSTQALIRLQIKQHVEHIKLADDYVKYIRQYSDRRYERVRDPTIPVTGPTLVELILSESYIEDNFFNAFSETVDNLIPNKTYGYIASSDHKGVVFFLLLFYGPAYHTEHIKSFWRQFHMGSFASGMQDIIYPEVKKGQEVYTFLFCIPNTKPGIADVRQRELSEVKSKIHTYATHMASVRAQMLPIFEYKQIWKKSFNALIEDFKFTSTANKSESLALAYLDVKDLEFEIRKLRQMIEVLDRQ